MFSFVSLCSLELRHAKRINARKHKRKSWLNLAKGIERIENIHTPSTSSKCSHQTPHHSQSSHKINTTLVVSRAYHQHSHTQGNINTK